MTLGSILHDMWDIFVTYYIGEGLLVTGVGYTLLLSAIAVFFGTILGSLLAVGKMSRFKVLQYVITAFVEIMRGTPALLQLYIAYFIVPMMLTSLNPTPIACVAIGLTSKTTMTKVVMPQAVRNILPALGNEFITIIKETSLASNFFVGELMTTYAIIKGVTFNTVPTLIDIGIIYFVMTFTLSKLIGVAERRMKAGA